MSQAPTEPYSSPDNRQKAHVALPDEPPEMTEPVAAALLQLLRVTIVVLTQQRPDAEDA
ncbi:hypothetical protein [Streptomyces sp. NPDC001153]